MNKIINDLKTILKTTDDCINYQKEFLKIVDQICIPKHNNIIDICQTSINRLNIQYGGLLIDSGGGSVNKRVEEEILKVLNLFKSYLNCYHPADKLAKSDIQSRLYPRYGCEVKVCTGWGKNKQIEWRNGTVQSSIENFLFIYAPIEKGKIVLKNIWFGRFSYSDWVPHQNGGTKELPTYDLRICRKQIKNKCKQLL